MLENLKKKKGKKYLTTETKDEVIGNNSIWVVCFMEKELNGSL